MNYLTELRTQDLILFPLFLLACWMLYRTLKDTWAEFQPERDEFACLHKEFWKKSRELRRFFKEMEKLHDRQRY